MADTQKTNDTSRMYSKYWEKDQIRLEELLEKMNNGIITKEEYEELQFLLICHEWVKKAYYPLCKKFITGDKLMFIADTHYGNTRHQNPRLVGTAFNEAIRQGIKTVVHAGDMTEGTALFHGKPKDKVIQEIETFINDIPHELIVELLLGNHEHNAICDYPDIIPYYFNDPRLQVLGMYKALINWDNQATIRIFHYISRIWKTRTNDEEAMINLEGHHHGYEYFEDSKTMHLASLSGMSFEGLSKTMMQKGINIPDVFVIGEKVDIDKIAFYEYCLDRLFQRFAIAEVVELNTQTKELKLYR